MYRYIRFVVKAVKNGHVPPFLLNPTIFMESLTSLLLIDFWRPHPPLFPLNKNLRGGKVLLWTARDRLV